jgi:mitogen-activated protein kinase 1/3
MQALTQNRILREVEIMMFLKDNDNIVSLIDVPHPATIEEFKDVYLVMDLSMSDLRSLIRTGQKFTDDNVKYFLYQMLTALKYVHSANILHRDLV